MNQSAAGALHKRRQSTLVRRLNGAEDNRQPKRKSLSITTAFYNRTPHRFIGAQQTQTPNTSQDLLCKQHSYGMNRQKTTITVRLSYVDVRRYCNIHLADFCSGFVVLFRSATEEQPLCAFGQSSSVIFSSPLFLFARLYAYKRNGRYSNYSENRLLS